MRKDIYLILSKSLLYVLIIGRNIYKGLIFFSIFVTNKVFNTFFLPKETLLDTTIFLISIFFIEVGLSC